ncbi:mitochondrial carrier, partial [Suillus weaverae]
MLSDLELLVVWQDESQRQQWPPLTESRSSSKPQTLISKSMLEPGLELIEPDSQYTEMEVLEDCFKATLQLFYAIKFMGYDQWRTLLIPNRDKETNIKRFTAGALAGMTSVTFTYPLELVRVRMAFHSRLSSHSTGRTRPSFLRAMRIIYNEGSMPSPATWATTAQIFERLPVLKFYRDFTVTMVGMIPYVCMAFLTWIFLRAVIDDHSKRPHSLANLAIGIVSGAMSQTASYPFEVVRRRMQVGSLTRPDRWIRWGETACCVCKWRVERF